jgi:hypothetical protein
MGTAPRASEHARGPAHLCPTLREKGGRIDNRVRDSCNDRARTCDRGPKPIVGQNTTNHKGIMRKIIKIIMLALAAVLLLSFASSTAGARVRIEVSTTAALLSGRLTFGGEGGTEVISDVTLHVTLLRLINKIRLEHVGDVTSVLVANCRTLIGAACAVIPLAPMRIGYGSIRGALPRIERGILLYVLAAFLLEIGGVANCLYRGLIGAESPENPALFFTILRNGIDDLVPLWEDELSFVECDRRGTLAGRLTAVPLITIRLLETR